MPNCCDDLSYAKTVKAVVDNNLGSAIRVKDPDKEGFSFIPLAFCPWCSKELDPLNKTPPIMLHRHC